MTARGVVYDLDGVLTLTAALHARAWQALFDEYFAHRRAAGLRVPAPFTIAEDYRRYVDGKPRLDGVRAFLASRGIRLPEGRLGDPPSLVTVAGLGKRKNDAYQALLASEGIATDRCARVLLREMRARGRKQAVATSSRSGRAIVARTGLAPYLDAVVDGNDIAALGLKGKPAPDLFWEAARRLGLPPGELDLVEDAIAGVQAGRAGGFACVVGVAREGNGRALVEAGADLVVPELSELLRRWAPAIESSQGGHMPTRIAHARWEGSFKEGNGEVEFGNGAFQGAYTFSSRFEEGPGTNPEEMLGAAHASCFSMALAGALVKAGFTPRRLDVTAHVTVTPQRGGYKITTSHLVCEADVPGIDDAAFQEFAAGARAGCPVSKALKGVAITLDAKLVSAAAEPEAAESPVAREANAGEVRPDAY